MANEDICEIVEYYLDSAFDIDPCDIMSWIKSLLEAEWTEKSPIYIGDNVWSTVLDEYRNREG